MNYPPLTVYKINLSDGTSYTTSMAATVTPKTAQAYFEGYYDEMRPTVRCESVETIEGPRPVVLG